MTVLKEYTVSFAPMSTGLWSGFWIVAIFSTAFPGSNEKALAMNTYWPLSWSTAEIPPKAGQTPSLLPV
jgi:hypothetical protein